MMKKVDAYEAEDGTVHLTKKDAAIATFRHRHGAVFREEAITMMLQRPRELAELLNVIGAADLPPPPPAQPARRRAPPRVTTTAPVPGTKRRKTPAPAAGAPTA